MNSKKLAFLAAAFLVFVLPLTTSAQDNRCLQPRGIPPYTATVTSGNDLIDYRIERGNGGTNGLIFESNGILTYEGERFTPAVFASASISKLTIYENVPQCAALAIPERTSPSAITTVYILNLRSPSSRRIRIAPLGPFKVNWNSADNKVMLCENKGTRFIKVNIATGVVVSGDSRRTGKSPCSQ
jgi:hypothetical protein